MAKWKESITTDSFISLPAMKLDGVVITSEAIIMCFEDHCLGVRCT